MTVEQQELIQRIESLVPCESGIPSPSQYERAVTDAVSAYSRRVPISRTFVLDVVAGTISYALPADFMAIVGLEMAQEGNTSVIPGGLIPTGSPVPRWTIAGGVLEFYTTPTDSAQYIMAYDAGHVLTAGANGPEYADMLSFQAQAVAWKAQADLLRQRAAISAGSNWSIRIGDESYDKRGLADAIAKQADVAEAQYERAIAEALGTSQAAGAPSGSTYGRRNRYAE